MTTELILWDWNGTLLDDVALCQGALNRLLARFGYSQQYTLEQYREIFGFPIVDYYIRAGFDFSRHPFDLLAQSYMDDYIPASEHCCLMAAAPGALRVAADAGVRQVILSASPVTTLERQVRGRGVRDSFEALVGLGDIYAHSKVEAGQRWLADCGVARNKILMVGDSVHDFEVAQALGVRSLLCSAGHQARHFLEATGAPVADSLSALEEWL